MAWWSLLLTILVIVNMINTQQIGDSEIPIRNVFEISLDLIIHHMKEKWTRILQIGNNPKQKVPALEFRENSTMLVFRLSDENTISYQREGEASTLSTMELSLYDIHHIKAIINQTHIVVYINDTNIANHTKHAHWRNIHPLSIKFCGAGSIENCANVTIMNLNVTSYDEYCIHYQFECDNYNAVRIDKIYTEMNFSAVNITTYPSPTKSTIFMENINNLTRGKVIDYMDIKNNIYYDFYFRINHFQNYDTNLLHIGDLHHNFGYFGMHGLHLVYRMNNMYDFVIHYDIEYEFSVNQLYHIQLKHSQDDIMIAVNDKLMINESLSGPQRHKRKDHVAVYMCGYELVCSDVDLFNFHIMSSNNMSFDILNDSVYDEKEKQIQGTFEIGDRGIIIRNEMKVVFDLVIHAINKQWTRLLQIGNNEKQKVPALEFDPYSTVLNVMLSDENTMDFENEGVGSAFSTMELSLHEQHHIEIEFNQSNIEVIIDYVHEFKHRKREHWRNTHEISINFCGTENSMHCGNITILNLNISSSDEYCKYYGFENCVLYESIYVDRIYNGMDINDINITHFPSAGNVWFSSEEISNLSRGTIAAYIDIKDCILYDFYFMINKELNYETNILNIGDGHHNFGAFDLYGLHLKFSMSTVDDKMNVRIDFVIVIIITHGIDECRLCKFATYNDIEQECGL